MSVAARGYGFTLVELLVVLAIISILVVASLPSLSRDRSEAEVQAAAEELAATLRQTRSLAMMNGQMYGVAFNIQNEPGSSGAVLNNRSGGHYYRIIGPKGPNADDKLGGFSNFEGSLLPGSLPEAKTPALPTWPEFLTAVASSWVGEPHALPRRRVRFLALSDTDEGPIVRKPAASLGTATWYGSSGERTYPRPYFGVFDQATRTLHGWGGYSAVTSTAARGLWYDGGGSAIVGCQDASGNPIPLVSADAMDACVAFMPNGRSIFLEFKRGRRGYGLAASGLPAHKTAPSANSALTTQASPYTYTVAGYTCMSDIPEMAHFDRHTGGYHITLAADALSDNTEYPDARAALNAIGPMYRVFIGINGTIRVHRVQAQEGYAPPTPWWPATAATWQDTTGTTANAVWSNCRFGWLHEPRTADGGLVPRGRPVCYVVSSAMLVNRTWWRQ